MTKLPVGDDPVAFDMLVVVIGNGLNPGLWKIDVLCYKVKAADRRSHCHNIRVDLIAHLPIFYQTFVVIYENGAIKPSHLSSRIQWTRSTNIGED